LTLGWILSAKTSEGVRHPRWYPAFAADALLNAYQEKPKLTAD
jgi:hypothetical protein